ncbi:Thioesterase superfamily [Plasmodiophora brassicae]|nr:hypothetical protein PBRA_007633 [Plasmodiophora brassicae]
MWRRALSTSSVSQAPRVVPNRGAYKCWVDIQTRWSDQDAFGHVTNSVFYSYFDTAITHVLIRRFNMMIGQTPTHALPAIPFVVASSCNYHRQISHPSVINAGVSISKLGNSSVTYQIGIFTSDGDRDSAAASGTLVHVFVDRDSHRPIPLPADLRQDLSEILVAAPAS